jgi:hypothetical protein
VDIEIDAIEGRELLLTDMIDFLMPRSLMVA